MLCNLIITIEADNTGMQNDALSPQWLKNYIRGMDHEIYGFIVSEEYDNATYNYLIKDAYQRYGICVFAAQINGKTVLLPLKDNATIAPTTVCFALAGCEEEIHKCASTNLELNWKDLFWDRRDKMFKREDGKSFLQEDDSTQFQTLNQASICRSPKFAKSYTIGNLVSRKSVTDLMQPLLPRRSSTLISPKVLKEDDLSPRSPVRRQPNPLLLDQYLKKMQGARVDTSLQAMSSEVLDELARQAEDIKRRCAEAPFILLLNLSKTWAQVTQFIVQSRSSFVAESMPIIILSDVAPPKNILEKLGMVEDKSIAFILGSIRWMPDLIRSGVKECSIILCIGEVVESESGGEYSSTLADADVVMLYRVLESFGFTQKYHIVEFKRLQNIYLLEREELQEVQQFKASNFIDTLSIDRQSIRASDLCHPRYASGKIFTPLVLASLMASAFRLPGVVEVMQALIMPDHDEDGEGIVPWQIRPRKEYVGITYRELLESLVEDPMHPVLPLGIFRVDGSWQGQGYVWTNPDGDTEILATDLIYVLGSHMFGKKVLEEGLLPFAKPKKEE